MDRGTTIAAEVAVVIETPDAEALRKALKSFFRDDTELIGIIAKQNRAGLFALAQAYKSNFGRDLLEDIEGDTSGDYRKVFDALFTRPGELEAKLCHKAMAGLGTNQTILIEMLCTKSNAELEAIKEQYKTHFTRNLEGALEGDLSGNFKRYMVMVIQGTRDEANAVDQSKVAEDVKKLYKAGEGKIGTEDEVFMMIFANRGYYHLHQVNVAYEASTTHTLEHVVKKEFSSHLQAALIMTLNRARGSAHVAAQMLEESMKGLGTDEPKLIRQFAIYHGHMKEVATVFQAMYGKTLVEWIKGDTSGNFCKLLCNLITNSVA